MSRHASPSLSTNEPAPSLLQTLVLTAAAGGMGWGIRGQYGHESGAMIAGVLVALVIGLLYCQHRTSLYTARVVALTAIGISFGGAMTYGQTVGLTHDPLLVGSWEAIRWGMLGLAIKGGLWIGFGAVLMGVALGGPRYRVLEIVLLFMGLSVLYLAGLYLLNEPFDIESRRLPRFYFSGDWYWQPDATDLKPRRECWGGLLLAWLTLWSYVAFWKGDRLARNLGLFGLLFGAIGFPAGQCAQAFHSWNLEAIRSGWFATIDPYMNWWNVMEIIFGVVLGAGIGLGVWLNRRLIPESAPDIIEIIAVPELILLALHAAAFAAWNFVSFAPLDRLADQSLLMGILPLALAMGGRYAPYLIALPLVAMPICGKTLREMSYETSQIEAQLGWLLFIVLPLAVMLGAAFWLARRPEGSALAFARPALLLTSWLYYMLNFAFFRFPWPWESPTSRTPSAIVFTLCLALLTWASLRAAPHAPEIDAAPEGRP